MNRRGDYIGTFTGKQFWPLDPRPGEVCLEDIAHALANICRFNGHSNQFYSVAHHCLNVEMILKKRGFNKRIQLYGLLHDAAEAYICDIPRPLKHFMPDYRETEDAVQKAIYEHFGLPWPAEEEEKVIKSADDYILALEAKEVYAEYGIMEFSTHGARDSIQMFYDEVWKNGIEHYYYYKVVALLENVGVDIRDIECCDEWLDEINGLR